MGLNENQIATIQHDGHVVVLACPGSGKSTVTELKIKHTISLTPKSQIIALSFTRESAEKAKEKIIATLSKDQSRRVIVGTFHSVALRQLKMINPHLKVIAGGQVRQFILRAAEECSLDIDLDEAARLIENLRSDSGQKLEVEDTRNLYRHFENLLSRNGVIDFGGILIEAVRLMRRNELPLLPCTHLFCDEAQDIDNVQLAWCHEYVRRGAVIFMVGDDDQSIYRFRSALGLNGMMLPHRQYGARVITLSMNYRCRPEIISAASRLIAHNHDRIDKAFQAHRNEGGLVSAFNFIDAAREANRIARAILSSCAGNLNSAPNKYSVSIKPGQWAVLARNNHNLSIIAMALTANGIPITMRTEDLWSQETVCLATGLLDGRQKPSSK